MYSLSCSVVKDGYSVVMTRDSASFMTMLVTVTVTTSIN